MAKYRFVIDTPEQLNELGVHVLIGGVSNLAAVWKVDRRKNGGKSKWDGKIFADFESGREPASGGRQRCAYIGRICSDGKVNHEATL